MKEKTLFEKVQTGFSNASDALLLIKAKGGFKFRQQIPLRDKEIDRKLVNIEATFADYVIRCIVAEHLLSEQPPSFLCRWTEYQDRLSRVLAEVQEDQATEGRSSRLRSFSAFLASGR